MELVNAYEELKAERLEPVLQGFDGAELDQLASLLERFSINLFQLEDSGSGFCLRCAAYGDRECSIVQVDGNCPYQRSRAQSARQTP
jgi:hypothetical protein